MMPRLDGFGVLNKLREKKPNGGIRVLVATAKSLNDDDEERLSTWPVVGVLNKGELDIGQMVSDVQKFISAPPPAAPNGPTTRTSKYTTNQKGKAPADDTTGATT